MKETKAQAAERHLAYYRSCQQRVQAMIAAARGGVLRGADLLDGPMRDWHRYASENPGAYEALGFRSPRASAGRPS